MKTFIGILLILLGMVTAVYVGIWLMLIGGIVQIVEAIKTDPVYSFGIAIGIVKIIFAGLTAAISSSIFVIPGITCLLRK